MLPTMLKLEVYRKEYSTLSTRGEMYANGEFFGYTLEDIVRYPGVKVEGFTAIPDGVYEIVITESPKYKKRLPELLNVRGFTGIRIHGGNDHEDTEGCILIAGNKYDDKQKNELKIWDSKSADMVKLIDQFQKCYIEIRTIPNT